MGDRIHLITDAEHGLLRTQEYGYGFYNLIWSFARADKMTLTVELPEPLDLMRLKGTRNPLVLNAIRGDGLTFAVGSRDVMNHPIVTNDIKAVRILELDVQPSGQGLLVVTLG
jgi:hypothetical protein